MKAYLPPGHDLPKKGDRLLEKFRIERVIGQGGAGVVYAAHHELLDQRIALKLLLAEPGSEAATRFVNEAKLAARIHSEHVCRVMDVGTLATGVPYIAMEYLEGHDLDSALGNGPMSIELVCEYILQALDAIAQAHAQGIVHRDLKPSNLYLAARTSGPPVVKVLDFGISKGDMLGTEQNVTSSRAILGSPSYMSPEQIKNARTVDARTDIWSLGVIMFELASGVPPFGGETVGEVFAKIIEADPPRLRDVLPEVPEAFDEAVRRCLIREREERFANVGDLATAIAPFAGPNAPVLLGRIRGAVSGEGGAPIEPLPPSRPRERSIASATAAPWTDAPVTPRRRSRFLLLPAAFVLGGISVYWLAVVRPARTAGPAGAAALASALPDAAMVATAGFGLDEAGADAAPDAAPSDGLAADAAPLAGDLLDASILDASEDAGDDGGEDEEEEEEDDEDAGVEEPSDGGRGIATAPRKPAVKKSPTKRAPGKSTPTKKKKRRVRR